MDEEIEHNSDVESYYDESDSMGDEEMEGGAPTRPPEEVCKDIMTMHNDMSGFETEEDSSGNKKYKKNENNYVATAIFYNILHNDNTQIRDIYKHCNTIANFGSKSGINDNSIEDNIKSYISDIASRIDSYHKVNKELGQNLITSPIFIAKIYISIMLLKLLNKDIYDYKQQWNKTINSRITELLGKIIYTNINEIISNIFQINKGINQGKGITGHVIPDIDSHKDFVNKKVFAYIDKLFSKPSFDYDLDFVNRIKYNFENNLRLKGIVNDQIIGEIEESRTNANKEYNRLFLLKIGELVEKLINVYPEYHNKFNFLKQEIPKLLPTLLKGQFIRNINDSNKMDFKYMQEIMYDINKNSGKLDINTNIFKTDADNAWYGIEKGSMNTDNPNIYEFISN